MSYAMISGSHSRFNLSTEANLSTISATPTPTHNLNFFKTNLNKPNISTKSPYRGAPRTTGGRATTITSLYQAPRGTQSLYEVLGIPETGSAKEIKKAYKKMARKYHPDLSPPDQVAEHTRKFILVKEAYDTLSDPTTRQLYDLGFDPTRPNQGFDGWREQWVTQLMDLKGRSNEAHDALRNTWGAQMRRRRAQPNYDYGLS